MASVTGTHHITLAARLERRTERVPFDTCWLWTGSVGNHGYGLIKINRSSSGKAKGAQSMKEYDKACRCCHWIYVPDGEEPYCGPCSRARGLSPEFSYAVQTDADWRERSGHVCPLLWTLEEQRLADRALARERRERWPDTQREEYEG